MVRVRGQVGRAAPSPVLAGCGEQEPSTPPRPAAPQPLRTGAACRAQPAAMARGWRERGAATVSEAFRCRLITARGWGGCFGARGSSTHVFPFLFCCLLIDRVAAVRSVDFAAEESVVAPPGGAPGTPAGYCWLLDMSLRRVTRSGWTCGVGDGHDDVRATQGRHS